MSIAFIRAYYPLIRNVMPEMGLFERFAKNKALKSFSELRTSWRSPESAKKKTFLCIKDTTEVLNLQEIKK